MAHGKLLQETTATLRGFSALSLHPIKNGGSSRRFFRIRSAEKSTAILVHDLGEKEENRHYARMAEFLVSHSVPVPRVLAKREDDGLLWLEDLGEQHLWDFRQEPWEIRRPLYESVLRRIAPLHRLDPEIAAREGLNLQLAFDERLYRWEQEYFVEHCLGGIFRTPVGTGKCLLQDPAMVRLGRSLASLPRHLVHRDFQSQNILIRDGEAWFIDFQGMRPGLFQYDLASLLCDPYVEISPKERSELFSYYQRVQEEAGFLQKGDQERIFWQCAVQRLMQALGAYGFLSIHCDKPHFRAHVRPALVRLREALKHLHPDDRLDGVTSMVENLDIAS